VNKRNFKCARKYAIEEFGGANWFDFSKKNIWRFSLAKFFKILVWMLMVKQ